MNIFIVVEGEVGEKKVYQHWVPLVNPELNYVPHISLVDNNNFSILSGGGHPQYFDVIDSAIDDVNSLNNIDRLVISVDSEDLSYEEKYDEILKFSSQFKCKSEIKIVVQHFCLETWGLGNRAIIRQNPQLPTLIQYRRFYNVRSKDPELLPPYEPEELNKSQFAVKYLRHALNDKFRNLTYTKSNPTVLLHDKYFGRVKERYEQTNHIKSFHNFLSAFI
jgi:hypothetical protein